MTKHELQKQVKKAMAGDREAFEAIYRSKAKVIVAQVVKLVHNSAAVEDAVQEIVIRMYQRIGQLRSAEAFNVWMYRIILSICHTINIQNSAHAHLSLDDHMEILEESEMTDLPAGAAELNERRIVISKAIDSLPERQRLALTMYYYEEMSYKEIAEVLDITVSGVAGNIMNAKQTLKQKLDTNGQADKGSHLLMRAGMVLSIRQGLSTCIDNSAPPWLVHALTEKSISGLAVNEISAVAAHPHISLNMAGVLKFAAVMAGTFLVGVSAMMTTLPSARESTQAIDAVIEMVNPSTGIGTHINPEAIHIEVLDKDGKASFWYIEDADGTQWCTGNSTEIRNELELLPPGIYRAVWQLEGANNRRTLAHREFEIR